MKHRRLELAAIGFGWVYTGLWLATAIRAVFAPRHELLVEFNKYHELWGDVGLFTVGFGLLSWLLFVKARKYWPDR